MLDLYPECSYMYSQGQSHITAQRVQIPYMVQLTCTMILLANVSQAVGDQLATAEALVVLQPYTLGCMER